MKRKLKIYAAVLMSMIMACSMLMTGCGTSDEDIGSADREFVSDSEIEDVLASPEDYAGKYIKISGVVSFKTSEDGIKYLDCYNDAENYKDEFVVEMTNKVAVDEGDFVNVDAEIIGEIGDEPYTGADDSDLYVRGTVEKTSYENSVGKADSVREVNKEETAYNVTLTVEKAEFTEDETRIYIKAKNDNNGDVSMYSDEAQATQDGRQIETSYSMVDEERPTIDTLSGGAEKDAVVTFKKMDPDKEITLELEADDAENYDWEHTFKITF